MTFTVSWRSRLIDGQLKTVGLLLRSVGGLLVYAPVDGYEPEAATLNEELASALMVATPSGVFDYLTQRGNGVTEDWSLPFNVEGKSIESAAAILIVGLLTHLA